jgi:hypothetical protein
LWKGLKEFEDPLIMAMSKPRVTSIALVHCLPIHITVRMSANCGKNCLIMNEVYMSGLRNLLKLGRNPGTSTKLVVYLLPIFTNTRKHLRQITTNAKGKPRQRDAKITKDSFNYRGHFDSVESCPISDRAKDQTLSELWWKIRSRMRELREKELT